VPASWRPRDQAGQFRDDAASRPPDRLGAHLSVEGHERFGERLHAYSLWVPKQARAAAATADAAFAAGVTVGPLQGLPVSIKDLFSAAGYHCFAGSSRRLPADPWERVSCGPLHAIQPARPYRARREPVTDPSGSEEQVLWVFVPIMQVLGRVMT
jgi:hypothetical protein